MSFSQGFLLGIAVVNVVIVSFVYRGRRDAVRQSFFLFGVGVAGWITSFIFLQLTQNIVFDRLLFVSAFLVFGALLLFIRRFPEDHTAPTKQTFLYFIPWILLAPALPLGWVVTSVTFLPDGSVHPENGPLFPLFVVLALVYIIASLWLVIRKFGRALGIVREQLRYLLFGLSVFLLVNAITNIVLPAMEIYTLNTIGPFATVILMGFTGYAIVRHRLLDIRIVIQRGVFYLLTAVVAVAVYVSVVSMLVELSRRQMESAPLWSGLIAAIVTIIGYPYFREWFHRATDPLFFKSDYRWEHVNEELRSALSSTIDRRAVLQRVGAILERFVKIAHVEYLLREESGAFRFLDNNENLNVSDGTERELVRACERKRELFLQEELLTNTLRRWMQKNHVAAVAPTFSHGKLVGILIVGEKRSGDALVSRDIRLLQTLSFQLGVASENIQLYERVKQHSEELEQRVKERTQELQHLYEAQSRFLADVSHQLQTPLTIFKNGVETLKESANHEGRSATTLRLEQVVENMTRMVNDLLALAKTDMGVFQLHKRSRRLCLFMEEMYEYVRILAAEKGLQCEMRVHNDTPLSVSVDTSQMRGALLNILSNAIKNTDEGGIVIEIDQEGNEGVVVMRDTGRGIPAEHLPRIFDRFYRVEGSGNTKGVGLGLAIAKSIVEAHGGRITVASDPDEGTEFRVYIPLVN